MKISEPFFYPDLIKKVYDFLLVHPESIRMEVEEPFVGDAGYLVRIQGHATDQGLIIGAGGQNIRALQTIVNIIALRASLEVKIKVLEAWTGVKEMRNRPDSDPEWVEKKKDAPLAALLEYICSAMFPDFVAGAVGAMHAPRGDGEFATLFFIGLKVQPTMSVLDALNTLFHAIGRAKGRNIEVHARVQTDQPVTKQCAAGRPEPGKVLGKVRSKPAR